MRKVLNSGKVFNDIDKKALIDFLEAGKEIPFGSEYIEFEKKLAEYTGMKHCFFVNSGSSANLLALAVFTSYRMPKERRLNKGDEVITLAASFPTTVFPIVQLGLVPVFVDIELETLNVDVSQLEKALSPKTRAIMMASTMGNPMQYDAVEAFCKKHNLIFINDCCDALHSKYDNRPVFTYGDVSTSSMYAAHNIFTGSGGAVFTNDDFTASLIKSYRGWGRGSCTCDLGQDNKCGKRFAGQYGNLPFGYDHKNVFLDMGYNLVATNIQAALGLAQLSRVEDFAYIRDNNFNYLYGLICGSDELANKFILMKETKNGYGIPFGFTLIVKNGERKELTEFLEVHGIQTRYLFAGNITKQPCFSDDSSVQYRVVGDLVNTDRVMNDLLWVGCWHGLTTVDMEYIYQTLKEYYA